MACLARNSELVLLVILLPPSSTSNLLPPPPATSHFSIRFKTFVLNSSPPPLHELYQEYPYCTVVHLLPMSVWLCVLSSWCLHKGCQPLPPALVYMSIYLHISDRPYNWYRLNIVVCSTVLVFAQLGQSPHYILLYLYWEHMMVVQCCPYSGNISLHQSHHHHPGYVGDGVCCQVHGHASPPLAFPPSC